MWKYKSFSCLPACAVVGPPWHDQVVLPLCPPIYIACHTIFSPGICICFNLVCRVRWCLIERSEWGFCFQVNRPVINKEGYCPLRYSEFRLCVTVRQIHAQDSRQTWETRNVISYSCNASPVLILLLGIYFGEEEKRRKEERWKMLWLTFPIILDHLNEWLQHPMPWRSHQSLLRRQRCQVSLPSTNKQ